MENHRDLDEEVGIFEKRNQLSNLEYDMCRGQMILKFIRKEISHLHDLSVLDLGCGEGGITITLSQACKQIVAMDILPYRIRLTDTRMKNKGIANTFVVRSDGAHLPFRDNSFNLVVVNGVLEWIPTSHAQNPQKTQFNALREVRRVLTNGGFLYLAIENRYFLSFFFGAVDQHSRLRFVTILPRKIATFYSTILKKRPYKTYLYSYWGLIHLLKNAGFSQTSFYVPFPEYRFPALVISIFDRKGLLNAIKAKPGKLGKLATKLILSARLTRLLIHHFIVIAKAMKTPTQTRNVQDPNGVRRK